MLFFFHIYNLDSEHPKTNNTAKTTIKKSTSISSSSDKDDEGTIVTKKSEKMDFKDNSNKNKKEISKRSIDELTDDESNDSVKKFKSNSASSTPNSDDKFDTFQTICDEIAGERSHLKKSNILRNFLKKGTDESKYDSFY
jgi:hypothetical protein